MKNTFLLFGLPGSGKGTQAQILAERFGTQHISCGDLFRWHIKHNSEFGQKAKAYIERGELTPDSETTAMFLSHLARQDFARVLIIEGFPRTVNQETSLESFIANNDGCIKQAILLQADVEELVKRISGRYICPSCRRIYNLYHAPPQIPEVCDIDGVKLERRSDDREDLVRHRLQTYLAAESPVWDYFSTRSLLSKIDATQPIEVVSSNLWQIVSAALT